MEQPVERPKRLHLRVYGGVQGVGFRAYTRHIARKLELCGYVRNCADGSVELEAAGDGTRLARLRAIVAKGPPYARVERVEELEPGTEPLGTSFEIRR